MSQFSADVRRQAAARHQLIGTTHEIPLTNKVPLENITGIVYAKPDVRTVPPTACKFWIETPPTLQFPVTLDHIYNTAKGATPGTAVDADHANWPPHTPQGCFDINLASYGFASPQYIAVAFNIDNIVNVSPNCNYQLAYDYAGTFSPVQAIMEGDTTNSLNWITEDVADGFTRCNVNGVPKTVVVVCQVVQTPGFSLVSFNLAATAVHKTIPNNSFTAVFDPKIKNDG
jgi:hypothetical protein